MSLSSWKKEFYKGRIKKAARDPLSAVEHSLRKWKGLRAKNIEAHKVKISYGDVVNPITDNSFSIDADSCALCQMCKYDDGYSRIDCSKCPIVKVTGRVCDGSAATPSPYGVWVKQNDPEPMIKVLKQVRKQLKEEQRVQSTQP
jgi:hypothetical protein